MQAGYKVPLPSQILTFLKQSFDRSSLPSELNTYLGAQKLCIKVLLNDVIITSSEIENIIICHTRITSLLYLPHSTVCSGIAGVKCHGLFAVLQCLLHVLQFDVSSRSVN